MRVCVIYHLSGSPKEKKEKNFIVKKIFVSPEYTQQKDSTVTGKNNEKVPRTIKHIFVDYK